METLMKFNFCTIVCNGCGERVDSNIKDEILLDEEELEYEIEDLGWTKDPNDKEKWLCEKCSESESHRRHPGEGRTIIEPMKLYGFRCDLCGREWFDEVNTGCTSFEDSDYAYDCAIDEGWCEIDGKLYCQDCWHNDEEVSEEEYSKTEGRYPNKKPCPSCDCPRNCEYFSKEGGWLSKCSLDDSEYDKCRRIIDWKNEKPKLEKKFSEIERTVKG